MATQTPTAFPLVDRIAWEFVDSALLPPFGCAICTSPHGPFADTRCDRDDSFAKGHLYICAPCLRAAFAVTDSVPAPEHQRLVDQANATAAELAQLRPQLDESARNLDAQAREIARLNEQVEEIRQSLSAANQAAASLAEQNADLRRGRMIPEEKQALLDAIKGGAKK